MRDEWRATSGPGADLQSAVSRVCYLLLPRTLPKHCRLKVSNKADCKSAPRARQFLSRKIYGLAAALVEWFADNARDLPWRRTCEPYAIWLSEIMLQQTQVKTVLPYWE